MSDPATVFSALFIVAGAAFALWLRSRAGVPRPAAVIATETGRTHTARMDKAAELRALIEAADERISILRTLTATGARSSVTGATAGIERKPVAPPAPPAPDAFTRRVYELADSGCAPVDIASELGEHTGKIELILALRRQSITP